MTHPIQRKWLSSVTFCTVVCIAMTISGCDYFSLKQHQQPQPSQQKKSKTVDTPSYTATPPKEQIIRSGEQTDISTTSETQRLAELTAELKKVEVQTVLHTVDAAVEDRALVDTMQRAAEIVDAIYKLQVNGNTLIWEKQVMETGEPMEQKIFRLYGSPWCRASQSEICNAVASRPAREYGTVFWPSDLTAREFEHISTLINSRELLSPFSLVVREEGRLKALSYATHPKFSDLIFRLSHTFAEAAVDAPGEARALLYRLSDEIQQADIFRMGADDIFMIGFAGEWRILFRGVELKLDKFKTKQAFEFRFGKPYKPFTKMINEYLKDFGQLKNAFQIGGDNLPMYSYETGGFPDMEVLDTWIVGGYARYGGFQRRHTLGNAEDVSKKKIWFHLSEYALQAERENLRIRRWYPNVVLGVDALLAVDIALEIARSLMPTSDKTTVLKDGKVIPYQRQNREQWERLHPLLVWSAAAWLVSVEGQSMKVNDDVAHERGLAVISAWITSYEKADAVQKDVYRKLLSLTCSGQIFTINETNSEPVFHADVFFAEMKLFNSRLTAALLAGQSDEIQFLLSVTPEAEKQTSMCRAVIGTNAEEPEKKGKIGLLDYRIEWGTQNQ